MIYIMMYKTNHINSNNWINLFHLLLKCNFITVGKSYINIATLYNISFSIKNMVQN